MPTDPKVSRDTPPTVSRTAGILLGCVLLTSCSSLVGHGLQLPVLTNWTGPWSLTVPTAVYFVLLSTQFVLRSSWYNIPLACLTITGSLVTFATGFEGYSLATCIIQVSIATALILPNRNAVRWLLLPSVWLCILSLASLAFSDSSGPLTRLIENMSLPTVLAGLSFGLLILRTTEPYAFRRTCFKPKHIPAAIGIIAGWILLQLVFENSRQEYNSVILATIITGLCVFGIIQRFSNLRLDNRNRDLLESLDKTAIVVITNPAGIIVYLNKQFTQHYGYKEEEGLGATHSIISSGLHKIDFWQDLWVQITKGQTWKGEICNKNKNGKLLWLDSTITPLLDENGNPELFLGIYFDITERKRQAEQLRQNQKEQQIILESLQATTAHRDRLVQLIAHDLRSPLATAIAIAETTPAPQKSKESEAISKMKSQAQRALSELEEFLSAEEQLHLGKHASAEQRFDPYLEILKECQTHNVLANEKSISLKVQPYPSIRFDGPLQLFLHTARNLLSNAIKHTPEKGRIEVSIDHDFYSVTLTVEDSGPGVPMEKRANLFKPFQSHNRQENRFSSQKSWGLGLSIVKELLTAQNGSITIADSHLGGARFQAVIPCSCSTDDQANNSDPTRFVES
ncbi:PAS fold family [Verrucomicrobiia bacterium DG1235]|nr:PAS fold family [Verrucomicrobiae bacterium DG1235]